MTVNNSNSLNKSYNIVQKQWIWIRQYILKNEKMSKLEFQLECQWRNAMSDKTDEVTIWKLLMIVWGK